MEKQRTKNSKSIMQNNTGGQKLSDIKTYYKASDDVVLAQKYTTD